MMECTMENSAVMLQDEVERCLNSGIQVPNTEGGSR